MNTEQQAQSELRKTLPGFNALDYADQQSLVATRIAEWQAQGRITTGASGELLLREREIVSQPLVHQVPAADTPMHELRSRLQREQQRLKTAIQHSAEANVLFERSTERLAATQADLRKYDKLDAEVEEHELRSLRDNDDAGLPYNLKRQLDARSQIRERAERASAAHNRVEAERHTAQTELTSAKQAVHAAAQAVAIAEARRFLPAIAACMQELATYRTIIASLQLPLNMPPDIVAAISKQPDLVRAS